MKLLLLSSWLFAMTMGVAAEEAERNLALSTCAPFQACFLRNLDTNREAMIFPDRPHFYPLNTKGYNVHCEISRELGAIDKYEFVYDGMTKTHQDVSGWMDGIGPLPGQAASTCQAVPWFNKCGTKSFTMKGVFGGQTCFSHTFTLNTNTCAPTKAPTKSPTKSPTKRPTRAPTKRPTPRPTRSPTKRPTGRPTTKAPTKRPTRQPTRRPTTRSPTRRPTAQPVRTPTKPPTRRPTRAPTRRPSRQPTKAPIDPCPGKKLHAIYGTCIPLDCHAEWKCPANSKPRTDVYCVDSINDCTCDQGYMKDPSGAVSCVLDPKNCRPNYTMKGTWCVSSNCPSSLYLCPANSNPKNECMRDFNDCACSSSYRRVGSGCVFNPCGDGKKAVLKNGVAVEPMVCYPEDCSSLYLCPVNSVPTQSCPWNFHACSCNAGYRKNDANNACELNPCGNNMKYRNGRCQPEWCSADFSCPEFAKIKAQFNTSCIDKMDHCECNDSYDVSNGKCVYNECGTGYKASPSGDKRCVPIGCDSQYRCPKDSIVKVGNERACITEINQCTCNTGFKIVGNKCVPNECSNSVYNCPAYSTHDPARKCCNSVSDCVCQSGYKVWGDRCIECGAGRKVLNGQCVDQNCNGSYLCPPNSKKKQDCCSSMTDCQCNDYFKPNGEKCDHDPNWCPPGKKMMNGHCCAESCTSSYQCPANADIDKSKDCIKTILDCKCKDGFMRSGESCIRDPCTAMKSDTKTGADGRCVPSWCTATFVCPANSKVKPDFVNGCVDNIWNCQCDLNHSLNKDQTACIYNPCGVGKKLHTDGRCVEDWCDSNYVCPANSKIIGDKRDKCIYSIWDCKCDANHTMTKDQKGCEFNDCGVVGMKRHFDGRCVEEWCNERYQCPTNSKIQGDKTDKCIYSIWDCKCDANHTITKDQKGCEFNPCGPGMKSWDGRCTEEWCDSKWRCPKHSTITKYGERRCMWGMYTNGNKNCECHYGFKEKDEKCVPDGVVCPPGKKLLNGHCSSEWCDSEFVCPLNSKLNPTRSCISEFDDCTCDDGYKKEGEKCVWDSSCGEGKKKNGVGRCVPVDCKSASFTCPENSDIKPSKATECIKDWTDCVCKTRFRFSDGKCVPNTCQDGFVPFGARCIPQDCTSVYQCPANAVPAVGKETACITSLSDCVCRSGYRLENAECKLNECGDGFKSLDGRCVVETCQASYRCPANSSIKEDKRTSCLESMADCLCNPGYRMEGNECVVNPCGDLKPMGKRCVPENCSSLYLCPANAVEAPGKKTACITSVADCVCKSGFRMENGVCVENPCGDGLKRLGLGPNGRCVNETCSSTYSCPANSVVLESKKHVCDITVADCACVTRFRKEGDICVQNTCQDGSVPRGDRCIPENCTSTYQCPANSRVVEEQKSACITDITSCACVSRFFMENGICVPNTSCQDGFKPFGSRCVPLSCSSTYSCPENFVIVKNKENDCITDVSSCVCASGFRLDQGKCVDNSHCGDGFKPMGSRCVPQDCSSTFTCPSNAVIATGKEKDCLYSVWDCTCKKGYRMSGGACLINTCLEGQKMLEGKCVPDWCTSAYRCPVNASPLPGKECLRNSLDCVCNGNYKMANGVCAFDPCGTGQKVLPGGVCVPSSCHSALKCPSRSTSTKDCIGTIATDCVCDAGYQMVQDACVPKATPPQCTCNCALDNVNDTCTSSFPALNKPTSAPVAQSGSTWSHSEK